MLDLRPSFPARVQNGLGAGRIRDIRRRQTDHQEPPIRIHDDMTLAANHLLPGVISTGLGSGRLDRRAVDDTTTRARFAPCRSRSIINAISWMVPNRKRRIRVRNHQYTFCQSGKSRGSIRQLQPVRTKYRIALSTSRKSTFRRRPRRAPGGSNSLI